MVARRACKATTPDGSPCRAPPLTDGDYCRMHSPKHAEVVQEARRLGGLRRRREVTVQGAFDVEDLGTVAGIVRILEIALLDTLGLENSIARARALGYLAAVGLKALELGDLAARIETLEALSRPTTPTRPSLFEVEPTRVDVAEAAS
jgi:hypothetical protein